MGVRKRGGPARGEGRTKPQRWEQRLGTRSPSENLGTKTMLKSQTRREGMEAERGRRRTNPGQGGEVGGVENVGAGSLSALMAAQLLLTSTSSSQS